jgi:hypothetical protein
MKIPWARHNPGSALLRMRSDPTSGLTENPMNGQNNTLNSTESPVAASLRSRQGQPQCGTRVV